MRREPPAQGTAGRGLAGRDARTIDASCSPSARAVSLSVPASLDDWTMTSARPLNALIEREVYSA